MRLFTTLLLCSMVLWSYSQTKTAAEIDRELHVLDSVAIAAAGIDTTTLDATEKQVLRHLLAGAWINTDDCILPTFDSDEAYYLAVQDATASLLREQGYVPPSAEQFRQRIHSIFGIAQGDEPQSLNFDGEVWVVSNAESRYAVESEEELATLHIDPELRQIAILTDLPILTDYRNRYPHLAAVEKHIDRDKRLQLLLDRMEIESKDRKAYSLELFTDMDTEWFYTLRKFNIERIRTYNKFLLNNDPVSFQRMLRRHDSLITCLYEQGSPLLPDIRTGGDIDAVFRIYGRDSAAFRGSYPGRAILDAAHGDLNGDGQDDIAFVIGLDPEILCFDDADTLDTNTSRIEYGDYPSQTLCSRTLIVALSEKGRPGLVIRAVHQKLIPSFPTWNSNADDAFEGIGISDGQLILHERSWMSAGSWWTGTFTYGFEYIDAQLQLTSYETSGFHRATGEGTSTSLNIKDGLCITGTYNISEETNAVPCDTTHFVPRPLIPFEKLERGGEYTLSESDTEEDTIRVYLLE